MALFNKPTETAEAEITAASPTPNDLAGAIAQQATILWQTALGARVAETAARHAWTQAEVIPWREKLDQAAQALVDFVITHELAFEQAKKLIEQGRSDLADIALLSQARVLYEAMDKLRSSPPRVPEGLSIESALRSLRHSGALASHLQIDQIVELTLNELVPSVPHVDPAVDDMISRTRFALEALPQSIRFATAQGSDFLFNHPTIQARLEPARG